MDMEGNMKPTKEMLEVGAFAAMVSNCCGVMVGDERVMCDDERLGDDKEERCRCREDFTAGLIAALSASPAGVVKPLEWRKLYEDSNAWPMTWHGKGLLDKIYPVEQYYSSGQFYTLGKGYDTLEAAKSAAFADYSARIMSAIEPAVVGVETQEVVDLVIAARCFWDIHNDLSEESHDLDKALEVFASRIPYENDLAALKGDEQ